MKLILMALLISVSATVHAKEEKACAFKAATGMHDSTQPKAPAVNASSNGAKGKR